MDRQPKFWILEPEMFEILNVPKSLLFCHRIIFKILSLFRISGMILDMNILSMKVNHISADHFVSTFCTIDFLLRPSIWPYIMQQFRIFCIQKRIYWFGNQLGHGSKTGKVVYWKFSAKNSIFLGFYFFFIFTTLTRRNVHWTS